MDSRTIGIVTGTAFSLLVIALLIYGFRGGITGMTSMEIGSCNASEIICSANQNCDDQNRCTRDICIYPGTCKSYCYHELIKGCIEGR
ncbi:hypothetical protein GF351_03585 [Candidatus Woesearchaeota archaeon]|nr:hypothetical protein [Candidatus Woesearchaeota archaeon]